MPIFLKKRRVRLKKMPFCTAVVAAAGSSQRMDGSDKLFTEICGAPVLAHTLGIIQKCGYINEIVIVTREDKLERVGQICEAFGISKASTIIIGGPTRLLSVLNGLYAAAEKAELIAIHDGARPCVDIDVINRTIESAASSHAAAPAAPVSSTIKRARNNIIEETIDRENLFEIQTPQVFSADLIKAALTNAKNKSIDVTDDCYAVELLGFPVHITEGSRSNIKITTKDDLIVAEAIMQEKWGIGI